MTFVLGTKSMSRLQGVHPDLVAVVTKAITLTTQDFSVFDGVRTLAQQHELVKTGASKTLRGKHLIQPDGYGHAVDLVPYINGQVRWEWGPIYNIAEAVGAAAKELNIRLRWGGVWDRTMDQYFGDHRRLIREVEAYCIRHPGPDFLDGPHYELV